MAEADCTTRGGFEDRAARDLWVCRAILSGRTAERLCPHDGEGPLGYESSAASEVEPYGSDRHAMLVSGRRGPGRPLDLDGLAVRGSAPGKPGEREQNDVTRGGILETL